MNAKNEVKRALRRFGAGPLVAHVEENWPSKVGRRERRDNRHALVVLAARLNAASDCVDVGAHRGDFLHHMTRLAPEGQHLAFEPLPHLHAALVQRFPDVEVRNAALSHEAGSSEFVFLPEAAGMSGLRPRADLQDAVQERLTVKVEVLDDVIGDRRPALIKIDVEGAEAGVLRGAQRTLATHRPLVLLEHGIASQSFGTTAEEVFDLLAEPGLRLLDTDGGGPYSRAQFVDAVDRGDYWNWLAC